MCPKCSTRYRIPTVETPHPPGFDLPVPPTPPPTDDRPPGFDFPSPVPSPLRAPRRRRRGTPSPTDSHHSPKLNPKPLPRPRRKPKGGLNDLQHNLQGIQNKAPELAAFLHSKNVHVAAFQETKLTEFSRAPSFSDYTFVRQDRTRGGGGGLGFLVHHSLSSRPVQPREDITESLSITIPFENTDLTLTNLYFPPTSSCPGYTPTLRPFLSPNTIVMGDLNAHDPFWYDTTSDPRGESLAGEIDAADFGVLHCSHPTRLPKSGRPTSPDVTLASPELLLCTEWRTEVSLGSDHLPIFITLQADIPPHAKKKTFTNPNRADWTSFREDTEKAFADMEEHRDVCRGERLFRDVVTRAAKQCIPAGRRPRCIPGLSPEVSRLCKRRDAIRQNDPNSPDILTLNQEISALTRQTRTDKWHELLKTFSHRSNPSKLFKTIKTLSGKTPAEPNISIVFGQQGPQ